jgi:hypothetical protein
MNFDLEYIQAIEKIKEKDQHIICKQCNKPLIKPVFCQNCCNFACQLCLSNASCCKTDKVIYLTDKNSESINGKGWIAELLEQLEIYCPINRMYGCEWTGKRADCLDHCNECIKKYQKCDFGCDTIIHCDDKKHYDECEKFNKWLDDDYINDSDLKNKCIKQIEYNINILGTETTNLKNQIRNMQKDYEKHIEILQQNISKIIDGQNKLYEIINKKNKKKEIVTDKSKITIINYDNIKFDKIRSVKKFELITQSQTYIPKQTGYILIITVGGGSGGGCGGTTFSKKGTTSFIEVCIVHIDKIMPLTINIGEGGIGAKGTIRYTGNYLPKNKYIHAITNMELIDSAKDGKSTNVYIMEKLITHAEGGKAKNSALEQNDQQQNKTWMFNEINKIYPDIIMGNYANGIQLLSGKIIIGKDAECRPCNFITNESKSGIGYGAGGGLCPFVVGSGHESYFGGNGTDGCVIIDYIEYES